MTGTDVESAVTPAAGANGSVALPAASLATATPVSTDGLAALQEQMQLLLAQQQEMAAQQRSSSQQTLTGFKYEFDRAIKRLEKSLDTSLNRHVDGAIKAAAKKSEEERRKAAGRERQELEKTITQLLGQLSAGLHRDLAKTMVDIAADQTRTAVTATVNALTPSIAAALQKELAAGPGGNGLLQASVERALASTLAQPLHDALRENFASTLIPAFERATQVMFNQVEGAFSNWLADNSSSVAASQSEAASALTAAVSQLQGVVSSMRNDLADTSRSLSRLASSTTSRVTAERSGSAGGAATLSLKDLESGGGTRQALVDPKIEIGALMTVRKYEDALVKALNTASLDVPLWTCKQVG
eukprot:GHRR01016681.1.p1 GENE.GHRR01016681.1~~GHRR01016681.1.p1  ORF type:complete len:408 (+),score=195.16 GHRR01016681.1:151-1224(+)